MNILGLNLYDIHNMGAHHIFPQKFRADFERIAKINVDDPRFGVFIESTKHYSMSYAYNMEWERYLRQIEKMGDDVSNGKKTSMIFDFADKLQRDPRFR